MEPHIHGPILGTALLTGEGHSQKPSPSKKVFLLLRKQTYELLDYSQKN